MSKPNTAPAAIEIWHARFRGLKIRGDFSNSVLPGMFEIQLRPLDSTTHLFMAYLAGSSKSFNVRPRTLQTAKEYARALFVEQISEWRRQ
jgi:hypothetical protein